jgi:hypothetical protein
MGSALRKAPERRFVEDELGIHELYDLATGLAKDVEYNMDEANAMRLEVASKEQDIELREWDLRLELRAVQSDGAFKSLAAEDRAVAEAKMTDERYVQRVQFLAEYREKLGNIEAALRGFELSHRSVVARMNSLSAYLTFLAACKAARTAALDAQIPV